MSCVHIIQHLVIKRDWVPGGGGGRPLGFGRQLPPQLTVGARPLGRGGGGLGGGGSGRGGFWEGRRGGRFPGGGGGAGTSEQLGMRPDVIRQFAPPLPTIEGRVSSAPPLQSGGQNQRWPTSGQGGYITPAAWGVPTASERGAESEVAHKWARWLHSPCRLGGPHRFRVGGKIRSGPQVGKEAT